jgi:hypothetical protein
MLVVESTAFYKPPTVSPSHPFRFFNHVAAIRITPVTQQGQAAGDVLPPPGEFIHPERTWGKALPFFQ